VRNCSWSMGEFAVLSFIIENGKEIDGAEDVNSHRNVISGVAGYNADANSLVSYARNAAQVRSVHASFSLHRSLTLNPTVASRNLQ